MESRRRIRSLRLSHPAPARFRASALLYLAICALLGAGAGAATAALAAAVDPVYQASVEKWRQDYEATIRSDDGWLTVTGLFWLHEGDNRFGSDPLGDIVVPGKSTPAQVGTFTFHGGKVVVHAQPNVKLALNGKPVQTAELHADAPDERLQLGDLSFFLHASGTRFGIRLKDKNSKARREFSGLHWFPIDPAYHVTARYIPYPAPKTVQTQNIVGDFDPYIMIGTVAFTLQGKQYQLEASENTPGTGTLFIVFRDLTSGKQTDAAARFLVTAAPKNGTVVLDFNEAYNPPCAYTAYATCPLPSLGNRMRLAIPVGEKNYKDQGD
jgi:uncharacterized protein (DUF1684 family)